MKRVFVLLLAFAGVASANPSPLKTGDIQATGAITASGAITQSGTQRVFSIAGTGLTSSGPTVSLAINGGASQTCPAGQVVTSVTSTGIVTCGVFVNSAGAGLTLSGSTISMPNVGPGANSYTYSSITLDPQGRVTAASSGAAPVTSGGAGTSGTMPVFTGPSTIGNSDVTDNTTTHTVIATATQITQTNSGNQTRFDLLNTGTGGREWLLDSNATAGGAPNTFSIADNTGGTYRLKLGATSATINNLSTDTLTLHGATSIDSSLVITGDIFVGGAAFYTNAGSIAFAQGTNSALTGVINDVGYLGGHTQFRSLQVRDGEGNAIATFIGAATPTLDLSSHKITSCANGTVSSDGACFGQIGTAVNAAVSGTSPYLSKFSSTNVITTSSVKDNVGAHSGTNRQDVLYGNNGAFDLSIAAAADNNANAFIFQNAYEAYNAGGDATLKWEATHGSFGSRGIAFKFSDGISFYADAVATTADASFTPTRRMFISNAGGVTVDQTLNVTGKSTLGDRVDFGKSGAVSYTSITNRGVLDYDTATGNTVIAAQNSGGLSHVLVATSNTANAATQLDIGPTGVTVPGTFGVSGVATFSNPATNGVVLTNSTTADTGLELINGAAGGRSFTIGSGATASTAPNAFYVRDVTGSTNRLKLGATAATINAASTDTFTIHGATSIDAALDMGSHLIDNVTDPSAAQDAATKNYVDTHKGILLATQVLSAASGTYTPTTGAKRVKLRMCAGGGGGGGAKGVTGTAAWGAGGAGGASGTCIEKWIDPAATITGGAYANGAGGAGGAITPAGGSAGSDDTIVINGTTYTAKGGQGGAAATASSTAGSVMVAGGCPNIGASTAADAAFGMCGWTGIGIGGGAAAGSQTGGQGGSSWFGAGGGASTAQTTGNAATGNGAGGAGGVSTSTTGQLGGAGTGGLIIVYEYQ